MPMRKKKENILAAILFIGLASHFLFGYFFWDEIKAVNIYYVSVYFLCDVFGFVVYLLANSKALKGVGALGMILGTFYLYQEFNDPSLWVQRDYITLGLVFLNSYFIWYFTDRFKDKNNKQV